jgi:hypothetical protein
MKTADISFPLSAALPRRSPSYTVHRTNTVEIAEFSLTPRVAAETRRRPIYFCFLYAAVKCSRWSSHKQLCRGMRMTFLWHRRFSALISIKERNNNLSRLAGVVRVYAGLQHAGRVKTSQSDLKPLLAHGRIPRVKSGRAIKLLRRHRSGLPLAALDDILRHIGSEGKREQLALRRGQRVRFRHSSERLWSDGDFQKAVGLLRQGRIVALGLVVSIAIDPLLGARMTSDVDISMRRHEVRFAQQVAQKRHLR